VLQRGGSSAWLCEGVRRPSKWGSAPQSARLQSLADMVEHSSEPKSDKATATMPTSRCCVQCERHCSMWEEQRIGEFDEKRPQHAAASAAS
jgi:hypothetical protein